MPASSASRRSVISPHWPRTSGRRSAVTRLRVSLLQRDLAQRDAFERAAQRAEALGAFLLDARDLLVRLLQRLAHRVEHGLDGFLALGQVAQRRFLLLPQRLPRQLQEQLVVAACSAWPAMASKPACSRCSAASSDCSRSVATSAAERSDAWAVASSTSTACVRRRAMSQPSTSRAPRRARPAAGQTLTVRSCGHRVPADGARSPSRAPGRVATMMPCAFHVPGSSDSPR